MRLPLAVLAAVLTLPAHAVGRLADVKVTDRDTGRNLPVHFHAGEYWVAGRPGAHYAIEIHSRSSGRLLAVTSVDGINVITGETAAHDQRGYVFDAWQGYDIAGWRKSDRQIAAFTFTALPRSYAARTGRPDNVGVIGVALFRDRSSAPAVSSRPAVPPATLPPPPPEVRAEVAAPVTVEPADPAAESRSDVGAAEDGASRADARKAAPPVARQAPSLGTGHGRREHSLITQVPFERARSTPDEVIRIRYDSHANLVAMGVIPPPRPQPRPTPDPFPDSRLGYVPDP